MWSSILKVIGIVCLVAAAGFWWRSQPVDRGDLAAALPAPPVVVVPTTSPSTTEPTATTPPTPSVADLIRVGGDTDTFDMPAPVRVTVGGIEVTAPVVPVGVEADGQMEIPRDVGEVGWYSFGPAPGAPGSAVLAGHVSSRTQGRGVFFDLKRVDIGDPVVVDHADGSSTTYTVVAVTTIDKDELPLDRVFARGGDPVLTLITCGGGFSRAENSYDSNVVVVAVPVDGSGSGADVPRPSA